jgi:hypothetical protein
MENKVLTQEEIQQLKDIREKNTQLIEQFGFIEYQLQSLLLQKEELSNNFKEIKTFDTFSLKKIFFSKKNLNTNYSLFNLFFLFNSSMFNSYFKAHHSINLFYVYSFSNKLILIDPVKFLIR